MCGYAALLIRAAAEERTEESKKDAIVKLDWYPMVEKNPHKTGTVPTEYTNATSIDWKAQEHRLGVFSSTSVDLFW